MSCSVPANGNHAECHAAKAMWRRRFSIAAAICLVAAWFAVYQTIVNQQARSIRNTKTAIVAAQAAAMSDIATILMSDTGQIIKSNSPADDMLAKGENVEGRNIHEFCIDKQSWDKAVKGMSEFYHKSSIGTVVALPIMMRLPKGDTPMVVIATTIKKTAGSDIAYAADLIHQTQFVYSPAAVHPPAEKRAL